MTVCRATSSLSPRLELARHREARMRLPRTASRILERHPEALVRLCFVDTTCRGFRCVITRDLTRMAVV